GAVFCAAAGSARRLRHTREETARGRRFMAAPKRRSSTQAPDLTTRGAAPATPWQRQAPGRVVGTRVARPEALRRAWSPTPFAKPQGVPPQDSPQGLARGLRRAWGPAPFAKPQGVPPQDSPRGLARGWGFFSAEGSLQSRGPRRNEDDMRRIAVINQKGGV